MKTMISSKVVFYWASPQQYRLKKAPVCLHISLMKSRLKNGVYENIPLLIVYIPCRVQVRGLRIWGGQRQWWVNASFLTILEVILNKATLVGGGKESDGTCLLWQPVPWRCTHPGSDRESFFQAKINLCFHNTVGSCKCKPHGLVPNPCTNSPLLPEIPSLSHLSFIDDSLDKLREEKAKEVSFVS